MNATEVIDLLEDSFLDAKERGLESVSIETLEKILDRARETAEHTPPELARHEVAVERYRYILAARNARWTNRLAVIREMSGHTISAGASALRSATLINGGAAVALLAFAGQAQSSAASSKLMTSFSVALAFFATGVLFSAVATGATYLSQAAFGREFACSMKAGGRWRGLAIFCVFLSFATFVGGGWVCAQAFDAFAARIPVESVPR